MYVAVVAVSNKKERTKLMNRLKVIAAKKHNKKFMSLTKCKGKIWKLQTSSVNCNCLFVVNIRSETWILKQLKNGPFWAVSLLSFQMILQTILLFRIGFELRISSLIGDWSTRHVVVFLATVLLHLTLNLWLLEINREANVIFAQQQFSNAVTDVLDFYWFGCHQFN